MRLLLDENVPLPFAVALARVGHDARHLGAEEPRGLADEAVAGLAIAEGRVLVTQDLDFGRLYVFHFRGRLGVVVLRLSRLTLAGMESRLMEFFRRPDLAEMGLLRSLVVLEPHRHRLLRSGE